MMTQSSAETPPLSRTGRSAMDVALEAARAAGGLLMDRWLTHKEVSYKGRADIVTDVDLAAEKAILGLLREEYPDFGILSEESEPIRADSDYTWVVDPLDGTRNYANGVPHFCTVVGLARRDEVVVGVTYDPARQELFTAEAGKGAYLNGTPISVTESQEMSQSLLSFDLGYVDEKAGLALDMVRSLWPGVQSMRMMGSAALGIAYAAAGRVDLYFHHSLSPWGHGGRTGSGPRSGRYRGRPPGPSRQAEHPQCHRLQPSPDRPVSPRHRGFGVAEVAPLISIDNRRGHI